MDSRSGEMLAFARVVETGSFSAAGKQLDLTASAVSKLVTRIEQRLGVLLFQRSTRHLAVTAQGQRYYEQCVRILADIDEAEQNVAQETVAPHGLLRINMSLPFGTHCILPLIPEFQRRYPDITLDLTLSDAMADLQRDQVDIAIRMGPLFDANYHARPLGRSRRAIVASPQYIAGHGMPQHPGDLKNHRCFNFNFHRARDEWPFLVNGKTEYLPIQAALLANNGETMRQLTLNGLGISRLGLFHVIQDIEAGRLVEILGDYNPSDMEDIHAVYGNQRYMPQRVRVLIDFLLERIPQACPFLA